MAEFKIEFDPFPTCRAFMKDPTEVRAIVGPLGSMKTSTCLHELLRRSVEQAPDDHGVRKTRMAIIRNTFAQLRQTVLNDIRAYFGPLCEWKVSESLVRFDFPLSDGTRVESDWLFIPLENPEDVRKLLSLQLTGAFIEEFREVRHEIMEPLRGRIGRYPTMGTTPTWHGIVMCSNPYPTGSDWHDLFEVRRPNGFVLYRQPSGVSPQAEKHPKLPKGYYDKLMEGATDEWIKVHIHGENGSDMSGQAVFGATFLWDHHTVDHIPVHEGRAFILGMDYDRNPAALIAQRDAMGRLLILEEVFAEGMGLETFLSSRLTPIMYERYPGSAYIIGDPSGVRKSSLSEESSFDVLRKMGYDAVPAPTNDIDPRLRAVDALLTSFVGGVPSLRISRSGCPALVRALASEYKFARSRQGELNPKPEKKHPWSDLVDSLQYLALGFTAARMGRPVGPRGVRMRPAREVSSVGWT